MDAGLTPHELPRREPLAPAALGGPQVIPRPATHEPGDPPAWSPLIGDDPRLGVDDVRPRLAGLTVDRSMGLADHRLRRSAVAAVLSEYTREADGSPGLEVLLTRRNWQMRTHRGEVSFPGGAEDPGDEYPVGTALREAAEEVGLVPTDAEVVGALDPLTTFTSDRVVVPVVVVTPVRPAVVGAPDEVDAVLHVPLATLLHPDCYHQERWTWAGDAAVPARHRHVMHFFDLPDDTVWGATAAMLHQLLTALLGVAPV